MSDAIKVRFIGGPWDGSYDFLPEDASTIRFGRYHANRGHVYIAQLIRENKGLTILATEPVGYYVRDLWEEQKATATEVPMYWEGWDQSDARHRVTPAPSPDDTLGADDYDYQHVYDALGLSRPDPVPPSSHGP